MNSFEIIVEESDINKRIDVFLAKNLESFSRSYIQDLIKKGKATIGGKSIKANYRLRNGDNVVLNIPKPEPLEILPENIPLDILYEDNDVILVNKPKGMVVHPAAGHYSGTLVNALLYHCKDNLSGINGVLRPGIVHRIDMDTTGVIIACKNDNAHQNIAKQLAEHSITRRYVAIVNGNLKEDEGVVDAPIARAKNDRKKMAVDKDGKTAVTYYKVLERLKNYTYIECVLETGRTHQIRVHMSYINHPLLGDEIYSGKKESMKLQGQCLHAMVLGFIHPTTNEYMEFKAPIPEYFNEILKKFKKN
ncbi:RluA family pseudouridine synthase [Lachnoanaerobaculum umeaense]|uniref:Pseudouridine synthase n=1 Tax=Lachnoanaerobaculum umeaense TaxID=617123 RepID=A0A385Q1F3_9FIRM|nr:RluA family pseudouridine synthase [Lachnoanaerobaculum umeaense]AYA99414.1 RluA family pseudouridine synthase [Lachnoanaerobaculum umeaense]PZW99514.1 RluA family pseudouridine synthase [Lachnoanaerobaculum umeaense]